MSYFRGAPLSTTNKNTTVDHSSASLFENRGVAGEQNEVNDKNKDILARLRERLLETHYRDDDIVKLVENLPE
jgi:hypothetical protein